MHRQGLVILLIIGFTFSDSYADPDPPVIRALVEVTLKNGDLIQGATTIAYVCDVTKDYMMHGIFIQKGEVKKIVFFDFDLDQIEINQELKRIVVQYETTGLVYSLKPESPLQLKYIQNHFHDIKRKEIEHVNDSLTWNKDLTYLTTDLFPVQSLNSRDVTKEIRLDEIQSIKLLRDPPGELLGRLKKRIDEEIKERPKDESGDGFNEALWYHEVIRDPRQLRRIMIRLVD